MTLRPVTEFFCSCFAPTEFFGRITLLAAYPRGVAPSIETARAVAARMVGSFGACMVVLLSCCL
jgi:hypothetical protein